MEAPAIMEPALAQQDALEHTANLVVSRLPVLSILLSSTRILIPVCLVISQILLVLRYKCYYWSDYDVKMNSKGGWSKEKERRRCVDVYNFKFAPDEPNVDCGGCWCCQPDN